MRKLKKFGRFLERHKLLNLNSKLENLNRTKTSKIIEHVIKKLSIKESLGPDGYTGEFCQTIKKDSKIVQKLFRK